MMTQTDTNAVGTAAVVTEPEARAPDPSDALPLIDRLVRVAGDHDGKFVVVGIGEDPDTDDALDPEVVHVSNGQADTGSRLRRQSSR